MQIRRMGIIIGLALVVGSLISMVLPESESKVEEQLFNEINYQVGALKQVTDELVQLRGQLTGVQAAQVDAQLQQAADWVMAFRPEGDTHEARKAYLIQNRDAVIELMERLKTTRNGLIGSNPNPGQ